MRSGSRVCLGRGLCIYTATPESPQYKRHHGWAPSSEHTHAHTHTCLLLTHVQTYLCVTIVKSSVAQTNQRCLTPPPPLLSERVRACSRVHTCVHDCACLLCRSGDQMSGGHGSYIRLSVLWLCVEILWHLLRRFSSNYASQTNPIEHQRDEKSSVK